MTRSHQLIQEGERMVTFTGLRHLHLKVRDVERSVAFYEAGLGMARSGEKHDGRMVFLATPGGGDLLTVSDTELEAREAGVVDPSAERAGDNGGVDHFGFTLEALSDFDAAVDQIVAAGGQLVSRSELAPGWPTAFLRDPDGYVFQI